MHMHNGAYQCLAEVVLFGKCYMNGDAALENVEQHHGLGSLQSRCKKLPQHDG